MADKNKIIIGIVGEIAAGKTTLTTYLKNKHNAQSARFSDSLRDILQRMYLSQTRANLQKISQVLRENFGQDVISKIMTTDIANNTAEVIITEGIRRPSDITYLKETYKNNFYIIYIKTNDRLRFDRLTKRSENPDDQTKTWEEFEEECNKEAEQKIKEISLQADFAIDNNGEIEKMHEQVDEIIKKLQ